MVVRIGVADDDHGMIYECVMQRHKKCIEGVSYAENRHRKIVNRLDLDGRKRKFEIMKIC